MGFRKYLPLKPREIEATLKRHGFILDRQVGDHRQWVGHVDGKRRVVTVPDYAEIGDKTLLKSIFSQSGLNSKEFYK